MNRIITILLVLLATSISFSQKKELEIKQLNLPILSDNINRKEIAPKPKEINIQLGK